MCSASAGDCFGPRVDKNGTEEDELNAMVGKEELKHDNAVVDPDTDASLANMREVSARMPRKSPVHWTRPDEFRPSWTLTKRADIRAVAGGVDIFLNGDHITLGYGVHVCIGHLQAEMETASLYSPLVLHLGDLDSPALPNRSRRCS